MRELSVFWIMNVLFHQTPKPSNIHQPKQIYIIIMYLIYTYINKYIYIFVLGNYFWEHRLAALVFLIFNFLVTYPVFSIDNQSIWIKPSETMPSLSDSPSPFPSVTMGTWSRRRSLATPKRHLSSPVSFTLCSTFPTLITLQKGTAFAYFCYHALSVLQNY